MNRVLSLRNSTHRQSYTVLINGHAKIVLYFFQCTSLCGLGQQYRLIQCPGDNESRCDPSTKPITNRTCVGNTCAKWRAGNWGECSATCGNGRQIRPVSCEHHDESMCRPHEKPISTRKCVGIPCPVWRTGDWSECSVTCGKGLETRNVICEHEHVNFTCNALEKPSTVRSCLQKVWHELNPVGISEAQCS